MNLFTLLKRCIWTSLLGLTPVWTTSGAEVGSKDFKADQLYQTTKVWTVHLTFPPEQWTAMEPKGGEGGFAGIFGGGGLEGRGGRPGGPDGFGVGTFLGSPFLTALDANKDGALTRDEFSQGFAQCFDAWNTEKSGLLTDEQLRADLNKDLPLAFGGAGGFGPPGGASAQRQ